MNFGEALRNALVGIFAGIFMILPGASGATVTVLFGVYERLIRDVSQLTKYLRKDLFFLITLGAGGIVGVVACSKGMDFLIDEYSIPLMFFFAALILVQLPDIWKQADDGEKLTNYNIAAIVAGLAVMGVILFIGMQNFSLEGNTGIIAMFLAGVIYAVCAISPGISGSTILLALGLYTALVEGVGNLDFGSILPLGVGAVVGVLAFAKLMDHFFRNNRRSTYCVIFGLTLGSVITVVIEAATQMEPDGDYIIPCAAAVLIGLVLGYGMHRLTNYIRAKNEAAEE
ncbi:MAG: DUF368 domain-containing protein [Candidatus Methanomethylophilaceae archaeon]|nr:DUF368 domain-containing protein [Candidatus Methanomethylophilaceae archaeon]